MVPRRRLSIIATTVLVVAAGGVGVAQALGGDGEASGAGADRAGQAALEAVGGGQVVGVEREGEGDATWEVEVRRGDGSVVEVGLTSDFTPTGTATDDDDGRADDDGAEGEGDDEAESGR